MTGFKLVLQRMEDDEITVADLVVALRWIRHRPLDLLIRAQLLKLCAEFRVLA
jgi:hypothetical protein